jgi:hypothetical protein
MAEKKNILEEALLDIKSIQSALDANTKEILRSIAREEIDGVVKESLAREAYDEEDVDVDIEDDDTMGSEEITGDDMAIDGMGDDLGDELGDMPIASAGEEDPSENGMDDFESSDELDMTAASDDEVIAIYKKLSGEDEINIVGDEIHLSISEPGEYIVKTSDTGLPASGLPTTDDDDLDYEIELDDEEESSDFVPVDDIEGGEGDMDADMGDDMGDEELSGDGLDDEEETLDEKISVGTGMSTGSHRGQGPKSIGASENPKSKLDEGVATKKLLIETANKYNNLLSEAKKLKVENTMFRDGLKEFRTKLVETVIFNSNLTYVTRLFMEHSTTKAEKQDIIKRFDTGVTNLKESKRLYRTIASELEKRETIRETVENKIIKEVSPSNSKQLNESTAYVDPSTKRILDLINRVEQK